MKQIFSRRRFFTAATGSVVGMGVVGVGTFLVCNWRSEEVTAVRARLAEVIDVVPQAPRLAAWWSRRDAPPALEPLVMGGGLRELADLNCPMKRRVQFSELRKTEFIFGKVLIADRLVVCEAECLLSAFAVEYVSISGSLV